MKPRSIPRIKKGMSFDCVIISRKSEGPVDIDWLIERQEDLLCYKKKMRTRQDSKQLVLRLADITIREVLSLEKLLCAGTRRAKVSLEKQCTLIFVSHSFYEMLRSHSGALSFKVLIQAVSRRKIVGGRCFVLRNRHLGVFNNVPWSYYV